MSKFKVGDRVVAKVDYAHWYKKGASGIVCKIEHKSSHFGTGMRVMFDSGEFDKKEIISGEGIFGKYEWFELQTSIKKPQKPHTETDRRKAAKAVRELEKKLNAAIEKAKNTGIKISFGCENANGATGIKTEMTYQPETPKMRKY